MKKTILIFLLLMSVVSGCVTDHEQPLKPKMYGSYTCPHCIEQKKLINASDYKYIECNLNGQQSEACKKEHIEAYPTWVFPSGERIEGVISKERFEELIK